MSTPRVLPADVYDTLHFSALAFGGIGGADLFEEVAHSGELLHADDARNATPMCILGHAYHAQGMTQDVDGNYKPIGNTPIGLALALAGIGWGENDKAVRARRAEGSARITFEQWCYELGVCRGDT